jgi:hypothetical protein
MEGFQRRIPVSRGRSTAPGRNTQAEGFQDTPITFYFEAKPEAEAEWQ